MHTLKPIGPLQDWTFGNVYGDPVFSPDGKALIVDGGRQWLTAWDTTTRALLWKVEINASSYHFSPDGKRVVSRFNINDTHSYKEPLVILSSQTGGIIGTLPTTPWAAELWMDSGATRIVTTDDHVSHGGSVLVLWDADHSTELRRVDLASPDNLEEERDLATLKKNPTVSELIEIAQRRRRPCEATPAVSR